MRRQRKPVTSPTPKPTPVPVEAPVPVSAPAPAPSVERGQIIEGAGSANFAWLKYPGRKLGVAFMSPKTGLLDAVTINWKTSTGYGAGNFGMYSFVIQRNGVGNFPDGGIPLGATGHVRPTSDGQLHIPIRPALTAGQIYHLVITNTDPAPGANWSSPNGLMTRVFPWDGTGCRASYYTNGVWQPWSSGDNPWNTSGTNNVNGEHIPLMLSWSDGTNTGDPYYSSRLSGGAFLYGANRSGEHIVWNQPTATINRIGVSVEKIGVPAGSLIFHLEQVGGSEIVKIAYDNPMSWLTHQEWAYVPLVSPIALAQGSTYRLWFESPGSKDAANCYFTSPVYGDNTSAAWLECSWGGRQSYFISGVGNLDTPFPNGDLSFSLQ